MKTPKNSLFLLLFNETPKESTQFHNLKKDFIEMNEWNCISQSTQTVKKKTHMYTCIDETIIMIEIKY